jgi:peptide/nickel transport system substrate-binding protein
MRLHVPSRTRAGRRLKLTVGGLLLAATATSAAATSAGAGAATRHTSLPSTLNWGISATPRTLFGPSDYSSEGELLMTLIQGQMNTYGPQEQLEPGILSVGNEVSPLEYTYTLRSGVKFSDGNPVTATDIAYTLNLQLNPKLASQEGGLFANVKSITSSGNTITIRLSHPDALVRQLPASICGLVYEKASVEKNLLDYGTPQVLPIGAGPYEVQSFVPDSQITLVPNPYYYGPKPHFSSIVFKIIPNLNTMLLALKSGQINGTFLYDLSQLKEFESVATMQRYSGLIWRGFTMDMTEAPFSDIHVRRALYYATNRAVIAAATGSGVTQVSTTVNEPAIYAGALPGPEVRDLYAQIQVFPYSVAKAKAELAKSSVPHGFNMTLNVPEDSSTSVTMAQIIKSEWAQIGVNVALRLMPGGPRFQIILNHKPDLGVQIIGNIPDALDPVEMPWEYFSSQQAVVNGNNSSNLRVPAVDALINAAQGASISASAKDTIEAAILASKYVPIIPVVWDDGVVAIQHGWHLPGLQAFTPATYWTENIQG